MVKTASGLKTAKSCQRSKANDCEWKRLLAYRKDGFKEAYCRGICGRSFWNIPPSHLMASFHEAEGGPPMHGSPQALLDAFEIDHISGRTYDGHISNQQALCHICNKAKDRLQVVGGPDWKSLCRFCESTKRVLNMDNTPLFKQAPQS